MSRKTTVKRVVTPPEVYLVRRDDRLIAIVTSRGRVYACTYSPDTASNFDKVLKDWKENRQAFRPYDVVRGQYL